MTIMYRISIFLTTLFLTLVVYNLQPFCPVNAQTIDNKLSGSKPTSSGVGQKSYKEMLQMVMNMDKAYSKVNDYSTIFLKQERIGGKLREKETIKVYFKKPSNLYMEWINEPNKGRQVIFRKGYNKDKLLARVKVLWGNQTVSLDPKGDMAMKDNRHPITEMGLGFLIESLIKNVKKADEKKELKIIYRGEKKMFERDVYLLEGVMPEDKNKGYYCYRTVLAIDKQSGLPIHYEGYMWDDLLYESYSFTELKINIGIEDKIFESFDNGDLNHVR
jgi:outer membrane lipoprotein-sorting protein